MAEGSSSLSRYHSEGRAAPREASHRLAVGPLFTASSLNREGGIRPGSACRRCQGGNTSLNSLCPRPAKSSSHRTTPRPGRLGGWIQCDTQPLSQDSDSFVDLLVPQLGPCFSGAGRPLLPRCRIFSLEAIRPPGWGDLGSSSKAWPLWREGNCDVMGKTVTYIDSWAPPTALRDEMQHRTGFRPGHCRAGRAGRKCRAPMASRLLLKR